MSRACAEVRYSAHMEYIDDDDLMTIRRRLATGELASQDFGATDPLRPNGLASAIARQTAGLGSYRKYDSVPTVGLPRVLLTVGVWGDQAASASL